MEKIEIDWDGFLDEVEKKLGEQPDSLNTIYTSQETIDFLTKAFDEYKGDDSI